MYTETLLLGTACELVVRVEGAVLSSSSTSYLSVLSHSPIGLTLTS